MFWKDQDEKSKEEYINLLKLIGSLSNLFSDSTACGAPFNRKKTPVRVFWRCARNLGMRDGKCDMKGIPEQVLEDMLCELLETNDLSHENITAKIKEMTITQPNEIVFFMKDGTEVKRTWKDRSRSESWTKEMREKVAEQNRKRARHE